MQHLSCSCHSSSVLPQGPGAPESLRFQADLLDYLLALQAGARVTTVGLYLEASSMCCCMHVFPWLFMPTWCDTRPCTLQLPAPARRRMVELCEAHDFSAARAHLIVSRPGNHTGGCATAGTAV